MKYNNFILAGLGLLIIISLTFCSMEKKPLATVEKVDLEKYCGKWYDIAHFPATFLNGCDNITAEYSMTEKKYIRILNRCYKVKSEKEKSITGKAFVVKGSNNSKLKVQFFWPFRADYWIVALDDNYQYAAVGGPARNYAWILARTPEPDEKMVEKYMELLAKEGFDVSKLERTKHDRKIQQ